MAALEVVAFEAPAEVTYGVLRAQLEQSGKPIGGNDLLIAAHALTRHYTLVTDNQKEFARVEDLRLENWLRYKVHKKSCRIRQLDQNCTRVLFYNLAPPKFAHVGQIRHYCVRYYR